MALDPRTVAPMVSLAAAWAVRKGMAKAYEKRHAGDAPPTNKADLATPLHTILLWAALTALSTALIDVIVQRTAGHMAIAAEARAEASSSDAAVQSA